MSLTLIHRLFMYGITVTLLIVWAQTRVDTVWTVFTHVLTALGTVELLMTTPGVKQAEAPKVAEISKSLGIR